MYLNEKKCFTVFNLRLAGYLMQNGFPLRVLVDNHEKGQFDQYLFDNTQELQDAIRKWNENRNKKTK